MLQAPSLLPLFLGQLQALHVFPDLLWIYVIFLSAVNF